MQSQSQEPESQDAPQDAQPDQSTDTQTDTQTDTRTDGQTDDTGTDAQTDDTGTDGQTDPGTDTKEEILQEDLPEDGVALDGTPVDQLQQERAERLDPENRPENTEVDNTVRDFDVEKGMFTDNPEYEHAEKKFPPLGEGGA